MDEIICTGPWLRSITSLRIFKHTQHLTIGLRDREAQVRALSLLVAKIGGEVCSSVLRF